VIFKKALQVALTYSNTLALTWSWLGSTHTNSPPSWTGLASAVRVLIRVIILIFLNFVHIIAGMSVTFFVTHCLLFWHFFILISSCCMDGSSIFLTRDVSSYYFLTFFGFCSNFVAWMALTFSDDSSANLIITKMVNLWKTNLIKTKKKRRCWKL
jgi:hypothetical protein